MRRGRPAQTLRPQPLGGAEPAGGRSDRLAADGLSQLPREDESVGAGPWPDAQCAPEGKQGAAQALGLSSREGKGWGPRLRAAVGMKVKGWCQGAPNTMTDKR